jgi:hypothetical protein
VINDTSLPSNFRILVGDFDITPGVDPGAGIHVKQERAEIKTPLYWSGSLTVVEWFGQSESLDDIENPTRWKRNQHPVQIYSGATLWATLRISTYQYEQPSDKNGGHGTATIELADKLKLEDYDHAAQPSGFDSLPSTTVGETGQQYSLVTLGNQLKYALRGATTIAQSDIIIDNIPSEVTFSAPQTDANQNPVQAAQEMAISAGFWMWIDKEEKVRFAEYPLVAPAPVLRKPLSAMLPGQYIRVPPDPNDHSTTEVESSRLENAKNVDYKWAPPGYGETFPKQLPTYALGELIEIEVLDQSQPGAGIETKSSTVYSKLNRLGIPQLESNGNFSPGRGVSTSMTFTPEGFVVTNQQVTTKMLCELNNDAYPGDTSVITGETITEKWTYSEKKVPIFRESLTTAPAFAVYDDIATGQSPVSAAGQMESWVPVGAEQYVHQLVNLVARITDVNGGYDSTLVVDGKPVREIVSAPPTPPTRTITDPNVVVQERGSVSSSGTNGGRRVIKTIGIVGQAGANKLAEIVQHLADTRRHAYYIGRAWDDSDVNFQPFQREDIYNRAVLRDGYSIAIAEDGLAVSYTGNYLGAIPAVTDTSLPPVAPPIPPWVITVEAIAIVDIVTIGSIVESINSTAIITIITSATITDTPSSALEALVIIDIITEGVIVDPPVIFQLFSDFILTLNDSHYS